MLVRKTASGNAQQRCIGSDMKLGSLWGEREDQRHVCVKPFTILLFGGCPQEVGLIFRP